MEKPSFGSTWNVCLKTVNKPLRIKLTTGLNTTSRKINHFPLFSRYLGFKRDFVSMISFNKT